MDFQRRFGGLERLYGSNALQKLSNLHVIIAGIGGVGSWSAEALARSGVGYITLVDLDHIAESNINRQAHALGSTLGKAKIDTMAERIHDINPNCHVQCIDDFVDPENVSEIFALAINNASSQIQTIILDCTDQVQAKVAMILLAKKLKLKILVCGGAGGKTDPFAMRSGDISIATHDALLSRIRNILRRQHGYPKAVAKSKRAAPKMGVWAVWFAQETILPDLWQSNTPAKLLPGSNLTVQSGSAQLDGVLGDASLVTGQEGQVALQGLSCAGYGSAVTITATMGLAVANQAIQLYLNCK